MTIATGVGSMPGDDLADVQGLVLDELADGVPHLVELPGRGIHSGMVGRTLALVTTIGVDLQPAGWRLTDAGGLDQRRSQSRLAQDLDVLEELAQDWTGAFKVQVAGPWTLAATVEKPRGDKVVSDHGARRDLAQALAEGVRDHVRDLRRRVRDAESLVVQVDEPALAAVAGGGVRTASGFGRHRVVHPPEITEHLGWVLEAITAEGAVPWVHSCAPETPLDLLRRAGAQGLVVDLSVMDAGDHDVLGTALEAGETVVLGVVPSLDPGRPGDVTDTGLVDTVVRWLDMLGLDPDVVGPHLGVASSCGTAGASAAWARQALVLARRTAGHLP
ncbi:methionine synthase [Nocardioides sp.]|uniref:methionine synthase n=1 Tax=Nocardioides sp. TaxID=35761 RepID=UPI00271773E1|nr:methionine synthase [Nocardioides sp.]MDO9458410.1 methionine synthase [Nocardioides sp.]